MTRYENFYSAIWVGSGSQAVAPQKSTNFFKYLSYPSGAIPEHQKR
jgi:hypothetical protein